MYNLISWYNQNRKKIWIAIITAVGIFLIVWRLIFMLEDNKNTTYTEPLKDEISSNLNSVTLSSQKSAITGQATSISKEGIKTIDNFVSYCNSGNLGQAYSLLTDECKQEMFPNINSFQEIYYKPIFAKGNRTIKVENWIGDIYIVDFAEDALSTGVYSAENNIRDYIAISKDSDKNYRLNINSYIGRTELNNTAQTRNLQIKAIRKDAYMDYEKYTFEITNNSGSQVLIANIYDDENVSYLVDKNNIKYNAAATELTETQLTFLQGQTKTIQIKYYNPYGSNKQIKRVTFPKIYFNYQAYKSYQNKSNYSDYGTINIEL